MGDDFGAEEYNDRIDCLRSGRDEPDGNPPSKALAGPTGEVDDPPPKKSKPSSDSPGLMCLGGAFSAFGGTDRSAAGSVVFGRGGAIGKLSHIKSLLWFLLASPIADWLEDDVARCDADRSNFAFSCTTLSGCLCKLKYMLFSRNRLLTTSSSPSASNVDGSGIGPSITHRLDSYFVLMKFSIFLARS